MLALPRYRRWWCSVPGRLPAVGTAQTPPLIAVMNSSQDLVDFLQASLVPDGFRAVTHVSTIRSGAAGPLTFLWEHQPDAVVYSVSPPYRESWDILAEVRRRWSQACFVVVTTNVGALRQWIGPTDAMELLGKPFDLDQLTRAVQQALAARVAADVDGTTYRSRELV
jgi:DNA-binding NtrC family response regulator